MPEQLQYSCHSAASTIIIHLKLHVHTDQSQYTYYSEVIQYNEGNSYRSPYGQ